MKRPFDLLRRVPRFGVILLKKPRFGLHGLAHMARSSLKGEYVIQALEYAVDMDCQASCEKCSCRKMKEPGRKKLTLDQIRRLGDDAYRLGAYEVNLTGGEPTLAKNLEEIVGCFHPKSTFIGLNTNGALLDRSRILGLKKAGVDFFKISIDSPIPAEHDALRGIPGLFDHILSVLRIIAETPGVLAHLCLTTTREQIESGNVEKAVALAREYRATIGFVFPSPVGGWGADHDVLLEPHHRRVLNRLSKHSWVVLHGNLGDQNFLCPCGTKEIYVSCYGDVLPCPFIQIAFGNVADESFESIIRRMSGWSVFQKPSAVCRASEDPEFIERFGDPLEKYQQLPLSYDKHPNIDPDEFKKS